MVAQVGLFTHGGTENWESRTIRGALLYHGITSKLLDLSSVNEVEEDLCVVLPSKRKQLDITDLDRTNKTLLLVGHHITLEYMRGAVTIPQNVILLYGEPYRTLPQVVSDINLLEQSRGKAILGALSDPGEYLPVPGSDPKTDVSLVVTSLGCAKKCAYCTYGSTYSRLYGCKFSRRERRWRDIENELIAALDESVDCFQMTASQFLATNPADNVEIRSLAFNWDSGVWGRPAIAFTVSPMEVLNNRPIIEAMSRAFHVYPRLSIDSFDDQALALFERNYDPDAAIKALEFLASLKLPLKVNYVFFRPGMNVAAIEREIAYLKLLASATSYLSTFDRLVLAYDIFSSSLLVYEAAPIAFERGVRSDYETGLPSEILVIMSSIQESLEKAVSTVQKGGNDDPLISVLEELERDVRLRN